MEHLPDNVLVMVMQYLDIPGVLRFRQLCTRFRDLALLPDVWQHRTLPFSAPWACPVLRLAPCLNTMQVVLSANKSCHVAFTSTNCAVTRLNLGVSQNTGTLYCASLLARQAALGRLRHVSVFFYTVPNPSMLLGTLTSTSGLESLSVGSRFAMSATETNNAIVHSTVSAPSLTAFNASNCLSMGWVPFLDAMLAGHAATLEVVKLGMFAPSTAALLTDMPKLCQLSCTCYMPGLEAAACETLRVLHLRIKTKPKYKEAAMGAVKLLQRAKYLREVTLEYSPPISSNTDVGADLVLALTSSGSRVEKLRIDNDNNGSFPQIYPLICAIPRLSALRQLNLELGVVPKEYLLTAITPVTAPSLELLAMSLPVGLCAHAWLHSETVKTVMSAKPSLHIKIKKCVTIYCGENSCEDACVLSCHKGLCQVGANKYLGLFAHGTMNKCSEDHSDTNCIWIHIP